MIEKTYRIWKSRPGLGSIRKFFRETDVIIAQSKGMNGVFRVDSKFHIVGPSKSKNARKYWGRILAFRKHSNNVINILGGMGVRSIKASGKSKTQMTWIDDADVDAALDEIFEEEVASEARGKK